MFTILNIFTAHKHMIITDPGYFRDDTIEINKANIEVHNNGNPFLLRKPHSFSALLCLMGI